MNALVPPVQPDGTRLGKEPLPAGPSASPIWCLGLAMARGYRGIDEGPCWRAGEACVLVATLPLCSEMAGMACAHHFDDGLPGMVGPVMPWPWPFVPEALGGRVVMVGVVAGAEPLYGVTGERTCCMSR